MEIRPTPPLQPAFGKNVGASPSLPQGTPESSAAPVDGIVLKIDGILTTADASREWVSLRLLPPLPGGGGDALTARVVGSGPAGLQLVTTLGSVASTRPSGMTLGSILRFEFIARVPLLAEPKPEPEAAGLTVARADLAAPTAASADLLSRAGLDRLTAALLLLLAASPTGLVRVRDAVERRPRGAGGPAAGGNPEALLHEGRQIAEDPSGTLWRILPFPWPQPGLGDACILRRERRPSASDEAEKPVRFMLEVSLRRFGCVQLDGLYRRDRFDLVLRSHSAFAAEIRSEAARRFGEALSAGDLAGGLAFSVAARFAVTAAPAPTALGIEV